jgi:hypothetical protein
MAPAGLELKREGTDGKPQSSLKRIAGAPWA